MVVPGIVWLPKVSRLARTSSRLSVPDTANAQYASGLDPRGTSISSVDVAPFRT